MNYSQEIINHFFQTFYHERIEIARNIGKHYQKQFDVSLLAFWFSVIDFYGGIYRVGKDNKRYTYRDGRIKLADKTSFESFVHDFFPTPENELGNLLYSVFRSGLVHQLSPKKGALTWDISSSDLIWVNFDYNNNDELSNKVITINIHQLEQLAYNSYKEFRRKVEEDEIPDICKNIYDLIISPSDGLGDGKVLNDEFLALPLQIRNSITRIN